MADPTGQETSRAGQPHLVRLERGWSLWRTAALRGTGLPFDLLDTLAVPELLDRPAGADQDRAIRASSSSAIDEILRRPDFRTALTWQNPGLVRNWIARYVRALDGGTRPSLYRRDRREALVARYLQRYCAKNETVGFFGAVAWAELTGEPGGLTWRGGGGIRGRSVHVEVWAVAAIAAAWRRDPRIVPLLPVRLDPASTFDGRTLRRPHRPPRRVDDRTAAILSAVNGCRRAGEVVGVLGGGTAMPALVALHDAGIVQMGFRIPWDGEPEAALRRQVEELPAGPLRAELLGDLDALASAKEAVRAAAEPEDLLAAIEQADGVVAKLAQRPAGPRPAAAPSGRLPLGRTPLYLDCRRDLDARLGTGELDRLRRPLAILLDAARWLAAEVGDAAERRIRACYASLRRPDAEVTLSDLQFAAADTLTGGAWLAEIEADFQLRWAEILPRDDADGPVRLDGAAIRPLADALFPAQPPRWAAARHHSPDLLAARSPDGTIRWVLGELHVALNTLESRVFLTHADDPWALRAAVRADLPRGRPVPVYPHTAAEASARTYPPAALDPPDHYRYWSYGPDHGHPSGAASVAGTALRVTERDDRLVATAPDGWQAPVLEFFGEFLTALVVNLFRVRPPVDHAPRVAIDDLVVCRESWRFAAPDIPVPPVRSADYTHRALRAWAAAHRLPRRVFVKVPGQPKPCYVDFWAPLLVDNFARTVRRCGGRGWIDVSEMDPGPGEFWLTDSAGHRYPAELRVVAVDGARTGVE